MKATTQLRNLLKEPGMLAVPGCYDSIIWSQHLCLSIHKDRQSMRCGYPRDHHG